MSRHRIEKLRNCFDKHSVNSALVLAPADIFYLTGVMTGGILALTEEDAVLYMPSVDFEEGRKALKDIDCKMIRGEYPWGEIGSSLIGRKTALDPLRITHSTYKKIKEKMGGIILVEDLVQQLRVIKEDGEINLIKKACSIAAGIVDRIDINEWVGKTEKELTADLVEKAWKAGCSEIAFTPVVAAGMNSAYPHHRPSGCFIEKGWVEIDFGVIWEGYCSDLTRTFILDIPP